MGKDKPGTRCTDCYAVSNPSRRHLDTITVDVRSKVRLKAIRLWMAKVRTCTQCMPCNMNTTKFKSKKADPHQHGVRTPFLGRNDKKVRCSSNYISRRAPTSFPRRIHRHSQSYRASLTTKGVSAQLSYVGLPSEAGFQSLVREFVVEWNIKHRLIDNKNTSTRQQARRKKLVPI